MVENEEKLENLIRHYQDSLKRNYEKNNESKILYNIDKLYNLPIRVTHLEATGIGRTVNGLRKLGGKVGNAAKSLVAKWKEIVLVEEVEEKESGSAETSKESIESCNEKENLEEDDEVKLTINEPNCDLEASTQRGINKNRENFKSLHSRKELKSKTSKKRKKGTSESEDNESDDERHRKNSKKHKKRKQESSESEDTKDERRINKHTKGETKKDKKCRDTLDEEHNSSNSKFYTQRHSDEEDNEKGRVKKHKSSKKEHSDKEVGKKYKSSKYEGNKYINEDNNKEREKKHKCSKSNEQRSLEHEKSSKPSSTSFNKHREEKHTSKRVDKENEDLKMKEERSSYKKDKKLKHREEEKKVQSSDKLKKDYGTKSERKMDEQISSKPEDKKSKKHISSKSSKQEKYSTSTKMNADKVINGIDSGSGASFAEALGMCAPIKKVSSSSTSSKIKGTLNLERSKNGASTSSHSSSGRIREKLEATSGNQEPDKVEVPKLLKEPLYYEPVDLNLSSLLPSITPNYRPLGNSVAIDAPFKKTLTDYEALSHVISTKNQRTKVYSGNKVSNGIVPSLFELCVRILQDNLDALEYTGGVPYSILKPILDKANPDQLYMMEHHNPYLIEDTDELWQLHCNKEFRLQKREEMESWRDMYMRCLDEREAKLKALTANIKQSQDKSTPVRTTKLAYVDGVVKPPRNIIRKQMKNGTVYDKKPAQTPTSRLNSLATTSSGESVPNPGSRTATSSRSSSSTSAMKPKKAPLMAKTLSFMKNRFKR